MAYEALDSLLQNLTQILKRDDHLTTHNVKRDIISIHDKAIIALEFYLKAFSENETIREVASTALVIIKYIFSPENLSDCGSIVPSVRVKIQLTELAEELDLIVGEVDYCKVNDVRQQSDYPALSGLSHRLERLAEKILSSRRDLADDSRSNDDSVNSVRRLNVVVGIDEDLSYSCSAADAVSSSSRSASTSSFCKPSMAYEALDSLLQKLTQILKRDDHLTTRRVKGDIMSIHTKAAVLQLNLEAFPEKETIREVAITTHDIIECVFSTENLSDCGSIEPSVRVSNQLTELAEELASIVGNVVDNCKVNDVRQQSDYPTVCSSSSRSAAASRDAVVGIDEDPTVSMRPIVIPLHRLRRLAEKILWSLRDLADYFRSNDDSVNNIVRRVNDSPRSASTSKDVVVGIDEDLSYSAADAVNSLSQPAPTSKDCVVVGFEEDLMKIMYWLLFSGSPKQEVLPIVGMAGIGKTTVAEIVYDHPRIMEHFDFRAWITLSQDFDLGITHFNLRGAIKGRGIEAEGDHPYDMGYEIFRHLHATRYLIVLDDIWSTKAWNDIRYLFPERRNESRIILTTRLRDVAASIADPSSDIHEMRLLDEQQSWNLFERKVFADQTCPLELQSVAKKIVKSCGGLPLSIVTVAEHLSNIDRTPKFWEQIVGTDGDGRLESIFSLSYIHLPHHLKACFLYMAGFPQDYEIRVSELIKLWIAEGFLKGPYESKSLEEMAEEYLKDLVEKSLVLVTSRKFDGKIKSCRLQNNVRDFCVRQAGQKKFILPVMDYLPSPILRRHFLPLVLKNHRRISATWYDLDLKDSVYSSYTHSIICIPQRGYKPKGSVRNFRSLRVLHVLRRDDRWYPELGQVFDLIDLTYLASNIPSNIVPPAISKLQNLQTLIIYGNGVRLPVEIWSLRQLRHLIAFSFYPLPYPEAAALPLENLQTLSLAYNFLCRDKMVKMIPNIRKLEICYSAKKFDEDVYRLYNLDYLRLLTNLTLSGCQLAGKYMDIIGLLPYLQVLKLRKCALDEKYREITGGEFPSLRLLLIDESNLQRWTSESGHFRSLERLKLHRCPYLSEIPRIIGRIPTLKLIEVDDLNKSLFNSAKEIQEDRKRYHKYGLEVRLKRF